MFVKDLNKFKPKAQQFSKQKFALQETVMSTNITFSK